MGVGLSLQASVPTSEIRKKYK